MLGACELTLRVGAALAPRLFSHGATRAGAILCVGDSNTFGVGAPKGRSYPDQLKELLAGEGETREVVNLAIPGFESRKAVDRLAAEIGDDPPSCVLFLAGVNDENNNGFVRPFEIDRASRVAQSVHGALRWSATWRFLETAFHVLQGDLERQEFGAIHANDADPERIDLHRFDQDYPTEHARGAAPTYAWLLRAWREERPELVAKVWADFTSLPDADAAIPRFLLPRAAYDWELARMRGEPATLPTPIPGYDFDSRFVRFARACDALDHGNPEWAHVDFAACADDWWDPRWSAYVQTHDEWRFLLARDWAEAVRRLEDVCARMTSVSLPVGLTWAVGGATTALALSSEQSVLAPWKESHAELWRNTHWYDVAPLAREWTCVADWVEAIKLRDAQGVRDCEWYVENWLKEPPRTAPLRWLVAHQDADFARLRAELPLEAPRASWIGPRQCFLGKMSSDELEASVGASAERLAALSRKHGFEVIVLTYLHSGARAPSDALRAAAALHGWRLVDMQRRYDQKELAPERRDAYFSADHHHPNEEGYSLMARAVLDELREAGIAR
jgi:lysophospholipase L1-like esterase